MAENGSGGASVRLCLSVAELQAGVEKLRDRDAAKANEIEAWIDAVCPTWSVIPLDADCCRQWAREMKGRPVRRCLLCRDGQGTRADYGHEEHERLRRVRRTHVESLPFS